MSTLRDLKQKKTELFALVADDDTYTRELSLAYNAVAKAYAQERAKPENARVGEVAMMTLGRTTLKGQVFPSGEGLRIELRFMAPLVSELTAQGFSFENLTMDDEEGDLEVYR